METILKDRLSKHIKKTIFSLRKAQVALKNIEDCMIALKIYNSMNTELIKSNFYLADNIEEIIELNEKI